MNYVMILGILAALCTTGSFVPQAIKTFKSRETKDISLTMYVILFFGISMWLVYGILRSDLPVISANAVTLVFVSAILGMKLRFG